VTYRPRPSPFISQDGSDIFHRDGRAFDVGAFGHVAEDLVAADPRALEYARRYEHLKRIGVPIYVVGILGMLIAPVAASEAAPQEAKWPAALGAFGLGIGVALTGAVLWQKGDVALVDAVNTYNDGVEARLSGAGR
jgi:hypothetical protein